MSKNWDFSGWATKAEMRCSDGRTIRRDAFKGCDGEVVPLVWNHRHNDPSEVLGHALLECKDNGVYAYCSFNNSEKGLEAKELVRHGDISALSIYANQLIQTSKTPPCDVIHGTIREVSLVLAGANPGAFIDNVMVHGEMIEDEAEIFHQDEEDDGLFLYHADDDSDEEDDVKKEDDSKKEKTVGEVLDTLTDEQKAAVGLLIDQVLKDKKGAADKDDAVKHADEPEEDDEDEDSEETIGDVMDTLTPKQRKVVEAVVGMALSKKKDAGSDDAEVKHADGDDEEAVEGDSSEETIGDVINTLSAKQRKAVEALIGMALSEKQNSDEEEDSDMKHNVFDNYEAYGPALSHADEAAVLELAQKVGSLKVAVEQSMNEGGVLAHAITDHNGDTISSGIANVDYFFPAARAVSENPELIAGNETWVDKVINGVHHTPFSRVKSLAADLTTEEARARGYVKGNQKVSQVIEALSRETTPQTIYKLQKLDRDDILDITTFNVVAWIKAELKRQLRYEVARAILIGDGRQSTDTSKIKEANVRPIVSDADTYTVKVPVNVAKGATDGDKALGIVDAVILSRKNYKGSGNPTFFVDETWLGQMLIAKDGMGRRIYETEASLAAALRVKEIVPVDAMDDAKLTVSGAEKPLVGVIVNLDDYNVGADKGGEETFFEDFDINYNRNEYLIETRMSGALVKAYSAMAVYINEAN